MFTRGMSEPRAPAILIHGTLCALCAGFVSTERGIMSSPVEGSTAGHTPLHLSQSHAAFIVGLSEAQNMLETIIRDFLSIFKAFFFLFNNLLLF